MQENNSVSFSTLEQTRPQLYATLQSRINLKSCASDGKHWLYSIVRKKGFLSDTVMLCLRQQNSEKWSLYYVKRYEYDSNEQYCPFYAEQEVPIQCIKRGGVIQSGKVLNVVFFNKNKQQDDWELIFSHSQLAKEWKAVIESKQLEARQAIDKRNNLQEQVDMLKQMLEAKNQEVSELHGKSLENQRLKAQNTALERDLDQAKSDLRSAKATIAALRNQRALHDQTMIPSQQASQLTAKEDKQTFTSTIFECNRCVKLANDIQILRHNPELRQAHREIRTLQEASQRDNNEISRLRDKNTRILEQLEEAHGEIEELRFTLIQTSRIVAERQQSVEAPMVASVSEQTLRESQLGLRPPQP